MAHDHSHHHHHHNIEQDKPGNIVTAFWVNTAFAVVEIVGGFYTNSVAILSDAVHDLGDSLSLGLAYYFHKKSKQKRDEFYSYGYRRFSLLGAFINSVILTISSIFILQESVSRLFSPEQPDARGMIILAIIGIIANGFAMLRLQRGHSINERVVSLHFLEDVLGWAAVLVASIVMLFADVPVLDPILSILIALYILYNVFKSIRTTFRILLQATPETVDEQEVRKKLLAIPGVRDIHDLHFWTMDGTFNIMTLHVVVDKARSLGDHESIKLEVKHRLLHLNLQHITVEMEVEGQVCEVHH
jgi:cobalt-zinc-cadmium efflux system protein